MTLILQSIEHKNGEKRIECSQFFEYNLLDLDKVVSSYLKNTEPEDEL